MNHSTTVPAEDNHQLVLSDPNTTTALQNTTESSNSSLSDDLVLPSSPTHDGGESTLPFNSTTNSSDVVTGVNSTEQGGNTTNSSTPAFTWDVMPNWNSSFWDRGGTTWGDPLMDNTNSTDATMSGPTNWEGYILGIFCMGTAMLFVLAPAWYMDRRRHLDFVGRERRDARSQRRRRRRRWTRRRRRRYWARRMLMMDDLMMRQELGLVDGQDISTPLTEDYILNKLVTRPLQASDLCMEDRKNEDTPSLVNVVSDKTDDTATISTNKDPELKYDDDDEDGSEHDEDSSSLDDEDADCCAICLGGYKIGDEICYPTESRPCPHYFHRCCLVPWLRKQNVCPCCRVQYLPSPPPPPEIVGPEGNELVDAHSVANILVPDGARRIEDSLSHTNAGGHGNSRSLEESNEAPRSGEDEIVSGDTVGIEVDIDSGVHLAPLEDLLNSASSGFETSADTSRGTSEELPACEKESVEDDESRREKPSAGLDMTSGCNSDEEGTNESSMQTCEDVELDAISIELDIEAQTQLEITCDQEEGASCSLGEDTEYCAQTIVEQDEEQNDTAPVADGFVPCATFQPSTIRKVSSSDDETSISA